MSLAVFLASATDVINQGAGQACGTSCNQVQLTDILKNVTNTLIFLIGALSVIMIIFGGLRYVISRGDSKQIETAKNTIIYAVGGLVVALVAYAVVFFVTGSIGKAK
jgi:high-affinity K+ transport system ATPase subunit B